MKFTKTKINDLIICEPSIFADDRGYFMESFNSQKFNDFIKRDVDFVQDNHSYSSKNTLRGLHYQLDPFAQGKLVRVVEGEVFDVAVDLRKSSETFGQWEGVILSGENNKQFWVPEGFAHGFYVISNTAHFLYKTTNFYNKESEGSIVWNDPTLKIDWQTGKDIPNLSDKDHAAPKFIDATYFN